MPDARGIVFAAGCRATCRKRDEAALRKIRRRWRDRHPGGIL
jgi:hypothetical protein